MSHGTAFTHLFESAERDIEMHTNTAAKSAIECGDATPTPCAACYTEVMGTEPPAIPAGYQRPTAVVSPWVRRNEDYAQYPQARGSQYEGSEW